ncbi:hypothetical protein EAM_1413 [Erwinia amylovora ATCC 49946]|nr:hypothetical protein EAM_1413 [Erwinia amylovora ATCC 49946]
MAEFILTIPCGGEFYAFGNVLKSICYAYQFGLCAILHYLQASIMTNRQRLMLIEPDEAGMKISY